MDYITLKNITKTYFSRKNTVHSLSGISFTVRKGEIVGLLGPNGAGKTTTINILAGLLRQDQGDVLILGKDPWIHHNEIRPQINIATAYQPLSDILTCYRNLKVYANLYGLDNIDQRINTVAKKFGMDSFLHQKAGNLSSGQQTRLILAKCFMTQPKIILMDECTVGLDPDIAAQVRKEIIAYKNEHDCALLFTSHNMDEVEQLCDRVAILNNGIIHAIDSPENLAASLKEKYIILYDISNQEQLTKTLSAQKISWTVEKHNALKIHVKDEPVEYIMKIIFKSDIHYQDLIVEKSDLEDYFLSVAGVRK